MRYSRIARKVWSSPTFNRLSYEARYFWFYILTNPHGNSSGYYRLPLSYISEDMQISEQKAKKLLDEILSVPTSNGSDGLCMYDSESQVIWIKNYLEAHPIINRKHLKGLIAQLDDFRHSVKILQHMIPHISLSSNPLHQELCDRLKEYIDNSKPSDNGMHKPIDTNIDKPIDTTDNYTDNNTDNDSVLRTLGGQESCPPASLPQCPQQKIVDLYHEIMKNNPQVAVWGRNEQKAMRELWQRVIKQNSIYNTDAILFWFKEYFTYCSQSKILTGRKEGFDWVPDLAWLISVKGVSRVANGRYHIDKQTKARVDLKTWVERKRAEINGSQRP